MQYTDRVDLKDGLLNNRICTVKFPVVESYFFCNTALTDQAINQNGPGGLVIQISWDGTSLHKSCCSEVHPNFQSSALQCDASKKNIYCGSMQHNRIKRTKTIFGIYFLVYYNIN